MAKAGAGRAVMISVTVRTEPDFDTRTYGSAKLSDLMRKISRFEVKSGPGGQLLARDVA